MLRPCGLAIKESSDDLWYTKNSVETFFNRPDAGWHQNKACTNRSTTKKLQMNLFSPKEEESLWKKS